MPALERGGRISQRRERLGCVDRITASTRIRKWLGLCVTAQPNCYKRGEASIGSRSMQYAVRWVRWFASSGVNVPAAARKVSAADEQTSVDASSPVIRGVSVWETMDVGRNGESGEGAAN